MNNPRITPKELNAVKGALRRVFSRSALRKKVLRDAVIQHSDPNRPKVKTWVRCAVCKTPDAISYFEVDHISPVVPIDKHFEDMSLDDALNRLWCEINNLQAICVYCHLQKSSLERKQRKPYAKPRAKKKKARRKLSSCHT